MTRFSKNNEVLHSSGDETASGKKNIEQVKSDLLGLNPDGESDLQDWDIRSVAPSGDNPGYKKTNFRKVASNGDVLSDNQLWYMENGEMRVGVYPKLSRVLTENNASEMTVVEGNAFDCAKYRSAIWIPTANADLSIINLPEGIDKFQLGLIISNPDSHELTIQGDNADKINPEGLTNLLLIFLDGDATLLSDYGGTGGGAATPKAFLTVRNPSTSSNTPGGYNTNTYAAVPFDLVVDDTETKWNSTTQKYAIPREGRYRVTLFVTLLDGSAGNTKFSMGAGVSAADSDFNAQYEVQGNGYSQSFTHVFYTNYNEDDQIMMYTRSNGYNYFRVYSMTIEEL